MFHVKLFLSGRAPDGAGADGRDGGKTGIANGADDGTAYAAAGLDAAWRRKKAASMRDPRGQAMRRSQVSAQKAPLACTGRAAGDAEKPPCNGCCTCCTLFHYGPEPRAPASSAGPLPANEKAPALSRGFPPSQISRPLVVAVAEQRQEELEHVDEVE